MSRTPRNGRTYNSERLYRDLVNDRITMIDVCKALGLEPELYQYLLDTLGPNGSADPLDAVRVDGHPFHGGEHATR